MIKGILWDFDGTLADSREGIIKSWQYIFKKIKNEDIGEDDLRNTFGEPLRVSLKKFFPDVDVEKSVAIYREYLDKADGEHFQLFENAGDILEEIKQRGVAMSLVTSRGRESTLKGLSEMGIDKYFSHVITADMVREHKPHPEAILKALELMDIEEKQAVMIGDTTYDIMAAKRAGVKSALVKWHELDMKRLESLELVPEYIIGNVEDLRNMLKEQK